MNKRQAGRLGGLETLARHGADHFRTIGRLGAHAFHARYFLTPIGMADFAIIDRETNQPLGKTLNGLEIQEYSNVTYSS